MIKNKLNDNSKDVLQVFSMEKKLAEKRKKEKRIFKKQRKGEFSIGKDQLDILYQVSELLVFGPSLKKILCLILKRIKTKMKVFGLAAWMKREEGVYSIEAVCGLPLPYIKFSQSEQGKIKEGLGMVGTVAKNKKPLFIKDVFSSPITPTSYLNELRKRKTNMGALLSIPLFNKGDVIGVLNFYFSETRENIAPSEVIFFSNITNQVATFIQNSKILQELQLSQEEEKKEKNRLANLQRAVQFLSLNVDKSLRDVLKEISNTLGEAVGSYALAIWKVDGDFLRIFVINGLSEDYYIHFNKNPISYLDPVTRSTAVVTAAVTLKPAFISDFWANPGIKTWPKNIVEGVQKEVFKSLASFPLVVDGKLFGVLIFYFLKIQEYPPSERYILQVAANTMSIAIGNAQYRQASKDAQVALLNMLEDTEEARARAEEERRKTGVIINNFSDGLLFFDEGNKLFLINPQAEIFFGSQGKNIIGKSISELGGFPAFSSFVTFLGKDLKSVFRKEFSIKDGLTLELSIVSMNTGKEKFGNLIILHDITREKIVERLKTEFVSISAHQLRTPLSAIKWTLRMLLDGDLGSLTNDQKGFIDKTYQSNERMIDLVNDLLDITRIEEGRYLYNPAPADIEQVIQFAIDSYLDIVGKKDLKIEFKKPNKKIPMITIDVEKMRLVIQNLIDNAVKYTVSGDKIEISLAYDENKKEIGIQVKDSGIGIPKEQQPRVFTKFFRADNASRVDTTGSGLGLFIAKNIIEAHGGKIWFKSPILIEKNIAGKEEGKGAIFYLALPVKKEFEEFLKEL